MNATTTRVLAPLAPVGTRRVQGHSRRPVRWAMLQILAGLAVVVAVGLLLATVLAVAGPSTVAGTPSTSDVAPAPTVAPAFPGPAPTRP